MKTEYVQAKTRKVNGGDKMTIKRRAYKRLTC